MIKYGRKLPPNCLEKIPNVVDSVSLDQEVIALFSYGSQVSKEMSPLSDLDFGILFQNGLGRYKRFKKEARLLNSMIEILGTEEIDLITMNDVPARFSYNIIRTGKLLFCGNTEQLTDFTEDVVRKYLDFFVFRERADDIFLRGIGYCG